MSLTGRTVQSRLIKPKTITFQIFLLTLSALSLVDLAVGYEVRNCEIREILDSDVLVENIAEAEYGASRAIPCDQISLGFRQNARHIKFQINRQEAESKSAILHFDYPPLDHLRVQIGADTFEMGGLVPTENRPIQLKGYAVPLEFSGDKVDVDVWVSTTSSLQVPIRVQSLASATEQQALEHLAFGVYYGILIGLFLYNMFVFFFTRDKAYLYYICYIMCYFAFQFTLNGLTALYLVPNSPELAKPILPMMTGFVFGFAFLFMDAFIGLKGKLKVLSIGSYTLSVVSFFLGVATLFVPYDLAVSLNVGWSILGSFIILIFAIAASVKPNRALPLIFLFGWIAYLSGIILIGLKNFGLLEKSPFIEYSMQTGSALEMILFSLGLGYRVRKTELEKRLALNEKAEIEQEATAARATARTVRMLAHDVRKPLSTFKVIVAGLKGLKSTSEVREFLKAAVPEVDRSVSSAEGLLNDLMSLGTDKIQIYRSDVSAHEFVSSCLKDVFAASLSGSVTVDVSLPESLRLNIDESRMRRVFVNILSNACEAINWKGRIWVSVEPHASRNDRVVATLGNFGSSIPAEICSTVFDSFYTANKKGGTGLGLAIARKWVRAHGGEIVCHSSSENEGKVEFEFDIPIGSGELKNRLVNQTHCSKDFAVQLELDLEEEGLAPALRNSLKASLIDKSCNILVVDDETLYVRGIKEQLSSFPGSERVNLSTDSGHKTVSLVNIQLLLVDYDLGLANRNGLDLIREARAKGFRGHICLHTNRCDPAIYKLGLDAGADSLYPKPISEAHLAKLILEALDTSRKV